MGARKDKSLSMRDILKDDELDNNCLTFGYFEFRFIWHNVKQFFKNIKYAYQRVVYGFCEYDTYNLNEYLKRTLRDTLKYLSIKHVSFPSKYSDDEWTEVLNDMAVLFDMSIDRQLCDDSTKYFINKYEEEYLKYLHSVKNDLTHKKTPEEQKLCNNYFNEEVKIQEQQDKCLNDAMYKLADNFNNLWD